MLSISFNAFAPFSVILFSSKIIEVNVVFPGITFWGGFVSSVTHVFHFVRTIALTGVCGSKFFCISTCCLDWAPFRPVVLVGGFFGGAFCPFFLLTKPPPSSEIFCFYSSLINFSTIAVSCSSSTYWLKAAAIEIAPTSPIRFLERERHWRFVLK